MPRKEEFFPIWFDDDGATFTVYIDTTDDSFGYVSIDGESVWTITKADANDIADCLRRWAKS